MCGLGCLAHSRLTVGGPELLPGHVGRVLRHDPHRIAELEIGKAAENLQRVLVTPPGHQRDRLFLVDIPQRMIAVVGVGPFRDIKQVKHLVEHVVGLGGPHAERPFTPQFRQVDGKRVARLDSEPEPFPVFVFDPLDQRHMVGRLVAGGVRRVLPAVDEDRPVLPEDVEQARGGNRQQGPVEEAFRFHLVSQVLRFE
ncbi:MAG TPA: hypothetical protein VIZ43_01070 [Trebonia sp.]